MSGSYNNDKVDVEDGGEVTYIDRHKINKSVLMRISASLVLFRSCHKVTESQTDLVNSGFNCRHFEFGKVTVRK